MNKHTWDILTEVLEQEPNSRAAKLKELCKGNANLVSELTLLIENNDTVDTWWETSARFNNELLFDVSKEFTDQFPSMEETIGQKFGAYTIVRSIGEGGMGKVFLAERSDGAFDRQVAIKLMAFNLKADTIREFFFREQKILASLNHSGIAQLYDAGISDKGTPYLVMELVDGIDLISYAKHKKLTLNEKVTVFIAICEAVEFAHRNLVVHRDLKPSNILISKKGVPKILDFGVSNWTQEVSKNEQNHEKAFTLKYSAPQQITGAGFNTSTDIYSLGILFFELLAETHPINFSGLDRKTAQKKALEGDFSLLSIKTGNSKLKGDLDAIVTMATQKEVELRYQTVQSLIQDLKNFQNNSPISARKTGVLEKGVKFWKRNPTSTTLAIIIGFGILLFTTFYNIQINKERIIAEREAEKANVTKEYLLNLFTSADPLNSPGEKQTVEDFLSKNITDLSGLDNEPEVKEEATFTLALVSFNLGAFAQAESLFTESYSLNKMLNDEVTEKQVLSLDWLGNIHEQWGDYEVSKSYFDSSLAINRTLFDSNHPNIAKSYSQIGRSLAHLGSLDSAESLLHRAHTIFQKTDYKDSYKDQIANRAAIADLSREQKDFARSARLLEENVALIEVYDSENLLLLANTYNNLGFSYKNLEDYGNAEVSYQASLAVLEKVFGESHPNTLTNMANLAVVYSIQKKLTLAENIYIERLNRVKTAYGENHWRVGQAHTGLGGFYSLNSLHEKSSNSYKDAVLNYSSTLGDQHFWTNRAKLQLSISTLLSGSFEEGDELFKLALSGIKENLNGRLTYYNYSSMEGIKNNLTERKLPNYASAMSDFIAWHNLTYPN